MIHGGMIDPITHELRSLAGLVILTDPDFAKGLCSRSESIVFTKRR